MTRKLVTIRKVLELKLIKDADFIEIAKIGGWQCVVKKGEFKVDDLALYFEIDSFLPIEEKFEFLRKGCYKKMYDGSEGFRLKTIRLRKKLSQGLLLPLTMFESIDFSDTKKDYAEMLGVKLWEAPIPESMASIAKGAFPSFIPKTDQERIQNIPEWFDEHIDVSFEKTEKIDGSSMTYYHNENVFGVCSKNLELQYKEGAGPFNIEAEFQIEKKIKELGKNIAIQGEIVGPGIQKNPLQLKKIEYYVYDIYDIDNKRYFQDFERMKIIDILGLKHVPILGINFPFNKLSNMEQLLDEAKDNSMFGEFKREGIVFKSTKLVEGQVISFKVINNDYLLKE